MKLSDLFKGCLCGGHWQHGTVQSHAPSAPHVTAGDWRSVPDDVFQLVIHRLSPADVGAACLTCKAWRTLLSQHVTQVTLPLSYLGTKAARQQLGAAAKAFPALGSATLVRSAGWCDPVQARLDLEPLVRPPGPPAHLEALAALQPGLSRLVLQDAVFTRQPLSLEALGALGPGGLGALSMAWGSALWAPGQTLQEWLALQPLFGVKQLTSLQLHKSAALYQGEVGLGDQVLGAAARLAALQQLELTVVKVGEAGLAALGALTGLTRLQLRGHITTSLAVLHSTLGALYRLEELELQQLLPTNSDLSTLMAAHQVLAEQQQQQQPGVEGHAPGRPAGHWGQAAGNGGAAGAGSTAASSTPFTSWSTASSSRGWLSVADAAAAAAVGSSGVEQHSNLQMVGGGSSSSSFATAGLGPAAGPGSKLVNDHGQTFMQMLALTADWSVALTPLTRLKSLTLGSDLVLLGSCAALRALPQLSAVSLKGAATYLSGAAGEGPLGGGGSSGLPASWLLQPGLTWPALTSLQVHRLHVADSLLETVGALTGLQQLVLSGTCMVTGLPPQPVPAAGGAAASSQAATGGGDRGMGDGSSTLPSLSTCLPTWGSGLLLGLSSLRRLTRFELHTPPCTPASAALNNHVLGELLQQWTGLTCLSLCLREEPEGYWGEEGGPGGLLAGGWDPLTCLSCCPSLEHLAITVTGFDGEAVQPAGGPPAAAGAGGGVGGGGGNPRAHSPASPGPWPAGQEAEEADAAAAAAGGGPGSCRSGCDSNGPWCGGEGRVAWGALPPNLVSLSLSGVLLEEQHIQEAGLACPHLRHLRLLYCQVGHGHLWRIASSWPQLSTLVVKESALDGLSANGLCAAASLTGLTSLGLTVAAGVDLKPLGALTGLRHLLLDARSNAALGSVSTLTGLTQLRALVLPLLALHTQGRGAALEGLVAALPRCVISSVAGVLGVQHGCQWFSVLGEAAGAWWAAPPLPWEWHPTFAIIP